MSQPVSDMLIAVKSREVQRGLLAEFRKDRAAVVLHLLAAAHLELVLASDYAEAGEPEHAQRSRISAASCLWRAGKPDQARAELEALQRDCPDQASAVQNVLSDLERNYPLNRPA